MTLIAIPKVAILSIRSKKVGVFSVDKDAHATHITDLLKKRFNADAYVFALNTLETSGRASWMPDRANISDKDGVTHLISDLDIAWLRRVRMPQSKSVKDPNYIDWELETRQWNSMTLGLFLTMQDTRFVNSQTSSLIGDNKLFQLTVASNLGFKVPKTIVSQDAQALREFWQDVAPNSVLAKPLARPMGASVQAVNLGNTPPQALDAATVPSIYQEYVEGVQHLRIHVFGEHILGCSILSNQVDWRPHMKGSIIQPYTVDVEFRKKLLALNKAFDCHVAIHEFKITPDDQLIYLETNPQGQFLFLEKMGIKGLSDAFCDALIAA